MTNTTKIPLAVDLDGTLLLVDTLHESVAQFARRKPWLLLLLPFWLLSGRAHLKSQIAKHVDLTDSHLPENQVFVSWLRQQAEGGRRLVLATAAHQSIADAVADRFGLFEAVLASNEETNLKSSNKAAALNNYFDGQPYSYAGDSSADMIVWESASETVIVGASSRVAKKARALGKVEAEFEIEQPTLHTWLRQLRVHQWTKNALVAVGPIAAHLSLNQELISSLLMAFLAFSMCASSVYLGNDLLDLESDRSHPKKRFRPLASGVISIPAATSVIPLLLFISGICAAQLPLKFVWVLCVYYGLTWAYSLFLKRQPVLDCVVLATLYTLRVIAGATALDMSISVWLLIFSIFLFLSLAFAKRFVELDEAATRGCTPKGRGYTVDDLLFVHITGVASGLVSVLVLGLYLNSPQSSELYAQPEYLWAGIGVFLYWVCWVWLKANRGEMHDDPVVFALKDKVSLLSGTAFGLCVFLAT